MRARGTTLERRQAFLLHLNELHAALDAAAPGQTEDCLGVALERDLNHWEEQHMRVQQTQQEASAEVHKLRRELSSVSAKLRHAEKKLAALELRAGNAEHELLSAKTKVRDYKEHHDFNRSRLTELESLREQLAKREARIRELEAGGTLSASRMHLERLRSDLANVRAELEQALGARDEAREHWRQAAEERDAARKERDGARATVDANLEAARDTARTWGERLAKMERDRDALLELAKEHGAKLADLETERDDLRAELERAREELIHATAPPLTPDTIGAEAERVVRAALEDHAQIDHFARLLLAILTRGERERDELERRLGSLENSLRIALEDHAGG